MGNLGPAVDCAGKSPPRARATRRLLPGLALLALVAPGCANRRGDLTPTPQVAALPQAAPLVWGKLRRMAPRPLIDGGPDRIDPTGRFVAVLADPRSEEPSLLPAAPGKVCSVWSVESEDWLGIFAGSKCAWPATRVYKENGPAPEETEADPLQSPDGTLEAVWRGAELSIRKPGTTVVLTRYRPRCATTTCPPLSAVRWAPDSRRLALTHQDESRVLVWDAYKGKVVTQLMLDPADGLLENLLAFGPELIVAVASPRGERSRAGSGEKPEANVYVFSGPGFARRVVPVEFLEYGGESVWTLDPNGRFLFRAGVGGEHESSDGFGLDLRTGKKSFLYKLERAPAPETELSQTWYPGPYPLFETLETQHGDRAAEPDSYRAWHLHLGPTPANVYAEEVPASEPPEPCRPRVVAADGKSLHAASKRKARAYDSCEEQDTDPSGRLKGTGKDRLTRLSDRVELVVPAAPGGCAETNGGVYSCLSRGRQLRFQAGDDPLRLVQLRGDQLMPLLFHPALIAEFLAGKPLTPAATTSILPVPTLELLHATYLPSGLRLQLRGRGGDHGTGQLLMFVGEREQGAARSLVDGQVTDVELPQLTGPCGELAIYLCNLAGQVCSLPAVLPACPR